MNGEWVLQIAVIMIPPLVAAIVGYLLGSKRQKEQILREHITSTVKDEYRPLFREIRRNTKLLDNYLENPFVEFSFPKLMTIYDEGVDEFVKNHHRDLFIVVDSFKKDILPELKDFDSQGKETRIKLRDIWSNCLSKSLPSEVAMVSNTIAQNLLTTMNPYNVLSLLLNGKNEEIRNKIEACILGSTSSIYHRLAKRRFVIKGQSKVINFDEIFQALMDKSKLEIANIVEKHKELKNQNDNEVKEKLLPLLKKYISNPI